MRALYSHPPARHTKERMKEAGTREGRAHMHLEEGGMCGSTVVERQGGWRHNVRVGVFSPCVRGRTEVRGRGG